MTSEQEAQLARRLASLQRWAAVMNYLLMYPDANRGYANQGFDNLTDFEAYEHCAERLEIHSAAIRRIINE